MAGKKSGRTSKTDHVLSLLAGAAPESPAPSVGKTAGEPAPTPAAEETPAPASAPVRHPGVPPILEVARANNEALSDTIREALTENLEQELAQQEISAPTEAPVLEEAPASEEAPVLEEAPASEEAPVLEEVSASETAPVLEEGPVPEKTPAAEVPAASDPGRILPDGAVYLNVMELLVEARMEKYVKLFGLCDCPRCVADVRALALSRLPAKYVVLPGAAVRPMMSMYEAKFESTVIAQVIYACKAVMESPRHTQ